MIFWFVVIPIAVLLCIGLGVYAEISSIPASRSRMAEIRKKDRELKERRKRASFDKLFPAPKIMEDDVYTINPDATNIELELEVGPSAAIALNDALIRRIDEAWEQKQNEARAAEAHANRDPRSYTDDEIVSFEPAPGRRDCDVALEWRSGRRTTDGMGWLEWHSDRRESSERYNIYSWGSTEPLNVWQTAVDPDNPGISDEVFGAMSISQMNDLLNNGFVSADWVRETLERRRLEREALRVKRSPRARH